MERQGGLLIAPVNRLCGPNDGFCVLGEEEPPLDEDAETDRQSTRLNSRHTEISTLPLHDALPICQGGLLIAPVNRLCGPNDGFCVLGEEEPPLDEDAE